MSFVHAKDLFVVLLLLLLGLAGRLAVLDHILLRCILIVAKAEVVLHEVFGIHGSFREVLQPVEVLQGVSMLLEQLLELSRDLLLVNH